MKELLLAAFLTFSLTGFAYESTVSEETNLESPFGEELPPFSSCSIRCPNGKSQCSITCKPGTAATCQLFTSGDACLASCRCR